MNNSVEYSRAEIENLKSTADYGTFGNGKTTR